MYWARFNVFTPIFAVLNHFNTQPDTILYSYDQIVYRVCIVYEMQLPALILILMETEKSH